MARFVETASVIHQYEHIGRMDAYRDLHLESTINMGLSGLWAYVLNGTKASIMSQRLDAKNDWEYIESAGMLLYADENIYSQRLIGQLRARELDDLRARRLEHDARDVRGAIAFTGDGTPTDQSNQRHPDDQSSDNDADVENESTMKAFLILLSLLRHRVILMMMEMMTTTMPNGEITRTATGGPVP